MALIDLDAPVGNWIDLDAPIESKPEEPRSALRAIGDTALQFGKGAVSGVRMLTDVAGADNAASAGLRNVDEALGDLLSASAKKDQQRVAEIMQEAEGKGWMEQISLGLKAAGVAPGALLAQAAGTSIPTLATALIPGAGPAALAARMGIAGAAGGVQGVGATKGAIYENTKNELLKAGVSPEEAEARAVEQQSYAGDSAGQIALGGGLGVLAGSTGMERVAAGLRNGVTKAAPGLMARVGTGGVVEAVPELIQGGQEKYATNAAMNNEGFQVDPMSGVVANATMEGVAGFGMGAAFGIPKARVIDAPGTPDAPALQIGNTPDPFISFPDGTVGRRADVEAYLNTLPEDQRLTARASLAGLAPQPARVDPITEIGKAASVDEAIAAAQTAMVSDQSDLDSLMQSEARNLQVMRAQLAQEREKAAQMDALQGQSIEALGRLPDQQVAAAMAATDETPTAMQLAMQRAQDKAVNTPQKAPDGTTDGVIPGLDATGDARGPDAGTSLADGGRVFDDAGQRDASPAEVAVADSATAVTARPGTADAVAFDYVKSKSGTLLVNGDPAAIRAAFPQEHGITKFTDGKPTGVLFGIKSAPQVEAVLLEPELQGLTADAFEQLHQQDVKEEIKQRLDLVKPAEVDQKKTPFKSFLREFGINSEHTSDIAGKNRFNANNVLPATFRASGMSLDGLVEQAIERGFMQDGDRGNQNKLIGMIQAEIAGETQVSSEFADVDAQQQVDRVQRMEIEALADQMGLPYDNDTSTDRLASMVKRVEDRLKGEPRGTLKADRILKNAQETVARIERKRAQYEAELEGFAQANIAEQDALLEVMMSADGNPAIVRKADIESQAKWVQLQGLENDQATGKQSDSRQAETPAAGVAAESIGDAEKDGAQAQPRSPQVQDGQEGLTATTPAQVKADEDRAAQIEQEKAKADKDAEAKAKAERIAKEIQSRQDASADNFQLGQSAEDSLAGQGSVFDAPAEPEAQSDPAELGIDYAADFAIRPVEITEILMESSAIKALYKAAGVKTADAFGDLPMESQSNAYAKFVKDGGTPAPAATESYNEKVTRMEREIVVRRLQSDQNVNQANGKPFKTEASAKQFSSEFDLDDTHKVAPSGTGYTLQRIGEGQRPSVLKAIAERQANDPEEIRQNAAWAKADVIGTAADSAVLAYGNGDTSIDEFERALELVAKPQAEPAAQATAILDAANITGKERIDVLKDIKKGDITPEELQAAYPAKIEDVGEKIGGARKDTATSTGSRVARTKEEDGRPTWAKRFQINQIAGGFDISVNGQDVAGKWTISDTRNKDRFDQPKKMGGYFDSREDAEAALPLLAVAQKHRVTSTAKGADGEYRYEIWRDINDRKRVKVVDQVFDTRTEAMEYMAKNAQAILETNTTFGEADLPKPESTGRIGVERRTGDVKGEDFQSAFGFRGVEFGNWNNQDERQDVMNAAYDGLMDLADVLNIPPKAIGLNGDLALAFGARGKGLTGARAHYETNRVVMNLTKMNGAGALAHEWFHALDHYLARQDGKTTAEWKVNKDGTRSLDVHGGEADMASSGFRRTNSGVREELRAAYTSLVQSLFTKAEQYVEDTARADKFVAVARGELEKDLNDLRKDLSEQKDVRYYKRNNKPASAEQLAEFDAMAAELVEGRGLSTEWKTMPGKNRLSIQTRHTNETLEKLNELYKAVRGRSGFNAEHRGVLDALSGYMKRYDQRMQMLREATALTTKTKRVPTSFAMDAKSLDQGRGGDYWTSPHEMVARAFQGYIEDKIAAKEGKSPFLNYAPENAGILTPWGAKRPFPAGEERKAMNGEFDKFVSTIQTKETEQGVAMFSRADSVDVSDPRTGISSVLLELGKINSLYQYPRSSKSSPKDIAANKGMTISDVDRNAEDSKLWMIANTTPTDAPGVKSWIVTLPGGKHATLTDKNGEVYINVSAVGEGQGGSRVYDLAANYAFNNGLKFIGDPNGVSPAAMRRRLENMLSAAIKYGSTDFLAPHADQVEGRPDIGVPALRWTEGDTLGNIRAMVDVSVASTKSTNPVATQNVRFDAATQSLRDGENNRLDDRRLSEMLDFDGRARGTGQAGNTTLRRIALFNSLLQSVGNRAATMEFIHRQQDRGGSGIGGALEKSFYSHAAVRNPSTVERVQSAVTEFIGGKQLPNQLGSVVATSAAEIKSHWEALIDKSVNIGSEGDAGVAQAFYDPRTKTVFLIADHISQDNETAVLGHELMHKHGQPVMGKAGWDRLHGVISSWEHAPADSEERAVYSYARNKVAAVGDHLSSQELFPYAVEAALKMGIQPSMAAKKGTVARWLESVRQNLQQVWGKITGKPETFKTQDLVDLAFGIAQMENPEHAGAVRDALHGANESTVDSGGAMLSRTAGNPHSWNSPDASKFDDLVYKLQDKQIDTKRVVESIKATAGALADEKNVYLQEELFHGRAAARTEDFVNKELGPLINEMKMRGIDIPTLDEYLHARHAEEANDLIAQRNPDIQDGGSGMTTQSARDYLAKLGSAERKRLEAVAAKVDTILAETRQLYSDYGLESADTVKGWGAMFKHYVPLMREDKDGGMGIGQGFSIKGKETKGRTGSTRKVVDILANIAMQRERAIVRGEKNRVATALVGLVKASPNDDFWQVGPPPMEKVYDPKTDSVVERTDPMYKSRDNVVVAKVKQADGSVAEQAVVFNEDNERALRMASALKNLDAAQLEGLLGVSAKITRYFAAINTQYNPIFGTVNLVRDFQGALLNLSATPLKGHAKEIAGHTLSALKGIYLDARAARDGKTPSSKWAQLWDEFQDQGGQTGFRDLFSNSADRAKAIERELNPTAWMDGPLGKVFTAGGALKVPLALAQKKATGMFDWLSDYNLAMENAVRLSAYKVALEQGMSKQQAASLGKNLTVNFNRKGQVGQQAGALYAFFNASMQGSARLGKTLFDMDGSDVKSIRLSVAGKKIVYGGILLGTMQALLLAAAGFDDEEPPDFVRERSLIIPTGGKSYITIPMPLGLHVLPNIGRIPTEFVLGGYKHPERQVAKLMGLVAGAFNPIGGGASLVQMLSPTAVDPLVALAENKDWTGKPIAKTAYNQAIPGHLLAKDTASYPAKLLAEAINAMTGGTEYTAGVMSPTPDQIDYLWGQATGGVGRELSKAQQSVSASISGEDLPIHKIPLVGRFYGNADTPSAQSGKFYSVINALNEHELEIKGLRKDGKGAEAAQYLRDNPEARLFQMGNAAERDIQKLRGKKRELIAKGAPAETVKMVELRIAERMTRFNAMVKRLSEKQPA